MSYFMMHSGKKIDLNNFTVADVCLDDIAHHLTKICRYGGALELEQHYSVAQHSILLAGYAELAGYNKETQKALLMHDAAEAYLGDIIKDLKAYLPEYKKLEEKVFNVIVEKYNIIVNKETWVLVKFLDTRIILDESMALFMPDKHNIFTDQLLGYEPLGINIVLSDSESVKKWFLNYCNKLGISD